jgi:hypothetical protein
MEELALRCGRHWQGVTLRWMVACGLGCVSAAECGLMAWRWSKKIVDVDRGQLRGFVTGQAAQAA